MRYTPYIFFVQSKKSYKNIFRSPRTFVQWIMNTRVQCIPSFLSSLCHGWVFTEYCFDVQYFSSAEEVEPRSSLAVFQVSQHSLFFSHNLVAIFPSDRYWVDGEIFIAPLFSPSSMSYHLTPPPLSPIQRTVHPPPRPPFKGWFFCKSFLRQSGMATKK